jgi:hypothetical protein
MRVALAIAAAALAFSPAATAARSRNSCESVIHALKRAIDEQHQETFDALIWHDGYTQWPSRGRRPWRSVHLMGPHPKYRTYIRELRALSDSSITRVVMTKEITLRVSSDYEYTGDYMVTKVRYICRKRNSQWRVFGHEVLRREELRNPAGNGISISF